MPYFYKLQEKNTGRYYVGCRYAQNANVSDLGTTYFTSSKYVKSCSWDSFNICYVIEMSDARSYEARFLKKAYRLLGRDRFMEKMINRNIAPGILNTPESITKANGPVKRKKNSEAAHRRLNNGTHNFITNKYEHTPEWLAKIKQRMLGDNNPSKNPLTTQKRVTNEYRNKQSENSKGNTNVRGKQWWNDGSSRKRSSTSPGEGWVAGYRFVNYHEEPQADR